MPSWKKATTTIASVRGFREYQRDERDGPDVPRTGGSQSGEPNTHAAAYPHPPPPRRNHAQPQQIAASPGSCQFQCLHCDFCMRVCSHGSFAAWVPSNDGRHSGQCPGRVNQTNSSPPPSSNAPGNPGSYPTQSGSPPQQQGMYASSQNQQYGQSPPPNQQYSPLPNQQYSPPPQAPAPYPSYQTQQPSQSQQPPSAPRSYPSGNYGPTQPQPTYGNGAQYAPTRYTHEPQGYSSEPSQLQRSMTWQPGYNTQPNYNTCPRCNGLLHSAGYCPYCNWRT